MIAEELRKIKAELPENVTLVAVSKFHPKEDVIQAYNEGQRIFGENIVQELRKKQQELPKDIQWHFVGHLQKNKIKYIVPFVSMIHSVDSLDLLQEINKYAGKVERLIPCLLQIHIAKEETKFGFTFEECHKMLHEGTWRNLPHVHICGLMCIASNVPDENQIAKEFREMTQFFDEIKAEFFKDDKTFCNCSWGMSHDYHIAIQNGSTMIRIGTRIFGNRPSKIT